MDFVPKENLMGEIFIETRDLTKHFGEVVAVNAVNMQIELGKVLGLIGENGSGKSTISSMISGIHTITSGEIFLKGEPYKPADPGEARKHGIGMIVQEVGTVDYISVAENIFLGEENNFAKFGIVNRAKMEEEARKALALVGLEIDVTLPAASYNFEMRKMVEIAKTLYYDPKLLIVDETTTALSQDGRNKIHEIIRQFAKDGKAVLFISHDLPELMETCDELIVLRDGQYIAKIDKAEFDEDKIKQTMVGRKIEGNYYRSDYDPSCSDEVALCAENVTTATLKNINLTVHKGEIVGIGGLSGSGMHEIGKLFFGMEKIISGTVTAYAPKKPSRKEKRAIHRRRLKDTMTLTGYSVKKLFGKAGEKPHIDLAGKTVEKETVGYKIKDIKSAFDAGIGYIAKDRDKETLITAATIKENLCLSATELLNVFGVIPATRENLFSGEQIDALKIKCSSPNQEVRELSGGNKQKVSFGKWIGNRSKILVFDSPTRGVDVGVKTTMYQLLYELKKQNYAILIISEEMPELIGMSDRLIVMKDGEITKEFLRNEDLRDTEIINYMI